MPVGGHIRDGEGSSREAGVTTDNAVKVAIVTQNASTIPIEQLVRQKQFRQYLVDSADSREMSVDGSVTPAIFTVASEEGKTKWVERIRIILNGANMEINTQDFRRFGAATAVNTPLTNGIEFFTIQEGNRTDLVVDPVQSIGDFMDYADKFTNFVNAVSFQSDFLSFDFVFDVPVVLPSGASDTVDVTINDDLSPIDLVRVLASGFQEVISV